MIPISRIALAFFTLAFALNHAIMGFLWFDHYPNSTLAAFAFAAYLCGILPSIILYRGLVLPMPQTIANVIFAVAIPILIFSQLKMSDLSINGNYLTWFAGGIETLMAVTAVRGRPIWAWVGVSALVVEAYVWGGFDAIGRVGIIGVLTLVAAATAVAKGLKNISAEADQLATTATETASSTARQLAVRAERKVRIEAALHAAQPILQRIIDLKGKLSEADKYELLLTELALRDEVYGKYLLDDGVRIAARDARRRGVEVTMVDGGGLAAANPDELTQIRETIAKSISAANSGTVAIRAPKGENFMVSITAQRPEANGPDLWLRLP